MKWLLEDIKQCLNVSRNVIKVFLMLYKPNDYVET